MLTPTLHDHEKRGGASQPLYGTPKWIDQELSKCYLADDHDCRGWPLVKMGGRYLRFINCLDLSRIVVVRSSNPIS